MIKLLKAEKRIRKKELSQSLSPNSYKSFEKALLSSPNSSFLWIKYAAFSLDNSCYEKSKEILLKALNTIVQTEEREKLNIFLALMNLESSRGSEESFEKATEWALSVNDHEKILKHKALKLLNKGKLEDCENTLRYICKKYSKNIENWENILRFYMKDLVDNDKFDEISRRAEQALKDSIEIRKRIGVLEYQHGSSEKARTIFENLLSEKPKRSDIWLVYLNFEEKTSGVEQVRDLYERVMTVKFSSKVRSMFEYKKEQYEHGRKHKDR